jgi:hypothetical protein
MDSDESETTCLSEEEKIFSDYLRNEDEAVLEQIAIGIINEIII